MSLITTAVFLILGLLIFQQVEEEMANYVVTSKEFVVVMPGDTTYLNVDKLKMTRKSRQEGHALHGPFTLFRPLTNNISVVADLFVQQGYEYRRTAYSLKIKMCDFIEVPPLMDTFYEKSDLPRVCPTPPGNYSMFGYIFDFTKFPPVLQSGDYMSKVQHFEKGKQIWAVEWYVHLLNKVNGKIGLK